MTKLSLQQRKRVFDLLTVIPPEHLTLGIGFVDDTINSHIVALYGEESDKYENAKETRTDEFWRTYFK